MATIDGNKVVALPQRFSDENCNQSGKHKGAGSPALYTYRSCSGTEEEGVLELCSYKVSKTFTHYAPQHSVTCSVVVKHFIAQLLWFPEHFHFCL